MEIGFNFPTVVGKELEHIGQALKNQMLSGNGDFTKKCQNFLEKRYGFKKCLLTTSCTDALEMAALLLNIEAGDEIIMPSFTFVSTANAFVLRGAKIVFADSQLDHPNMDASVIESLITPQTKAIVVVHYAGTACNMDEIMKIAYRFNLFVVEDAAQAIDNYYINDHQQRIPLGSFGHLATFSFHETKNVISGEGGMLVINDEQFIERAEIIWEKGTNRSAFYLGKVNKYGWVDVGSSFLPSELNAAFLWGQLEKLDEIQQKRTMLWEQYEALLADSPFAQVVDLPKLPTYSLNNGHIFYLICKSLNQRTALINHLKSDGIHAVFHYQSLHLSPFFKDKHDGRPLLNADRFSNQLVRLPMHLKLDSVSIQYIANSLLRFDVLE
jgi:dTDP-4-amino-4,6-dideoxygalactose transaminase